MKVCSCYPADLVRISLNEAARGVLEDLMASGHYEYQSDFVKKHVAVGRAEGRVEGEAKAVLLVLEARGLRIGEDVRTRILACTEPSVLECWIQRAATVASVAELFGDE